MFLSLYGKRGDVTVRLTFYDIPGLGHRLIAVSLLYFGLARSNPQ